MERLTFSFLKTLSKDLKFDIDNSYQISYPHFINFFKNKEINEENLTIASFFVYGWMPTILKKINITDNVLKDLNEAKNQNEPFSADKLKELKGFINNSVVGLSKLLHFINPEVYAIWDSKICYKLTDKKHQQKVNNAKNYSEYLQKLHAIQNEEGFKEWKIEFDSKSPYHFSSLRAMEYTLFYEKK